MINYQHERVVIVGLGITGISCINFFLRKGVTPYIMDTRTSPPGLKRLPPGIPCYLGGLNKQWLFQATLIIISPGISLHHPIIADLIGKIEIIGDIELFARENTLPVVGITGSNGKTTVTKLLGDIAIQAGWKVSIGGNIGQPVLDLLHTAPQLYILELSSFQLETTYNLHLTVATILNITENHMDRYPLGLKQYQEAKFRIFHNSSTCIINTQDLLSTPLKKNKRYITFGVKDGEYNLITHKGDTWLAVHGQPLLNCKNMSIFGQHNYINALVALSLADTINIPRIFSLHVLRQFHCLPHRCELVYDHKGVRWINDSKSTNIASTQVAIQGLNITGTLHLLIGGYGKCANFNSLITWIEEKNIALYCFGQDGPNLAKLCHNNVLLADTLEQIMYIIGKRVKKGDLVLLSPACASTDQFINFEERGKVFTKLAYKVG